MARCQTHSSSKEYALAHCLVLNTVLSCIVCNCNQPAPKVLLVFWSGPGNVAVTPATNVPEGTRCFSLLDPLGRCHNTFNGLTQTMWLMWSMCLKPMYQKLDEILDRRLFSLPHFYAVHWVYVLLHYIYSRPPGNHLSISKYLWVLCNAVHQDSPTDIWTAQFSTGYGSPRKRLPFPTLTYRSMTRSRFCQTISPEPALRSRWKLSRHKRSPWATLVALAGGPADETWCHIWVISESYLQHWVQWHWEIHEHPTSWCAGWQGGETKCWAWFFANHGEVPKVADNLILEKTSAKLVVWYDPKLSWQIVGQFWSIHLINFVTLWWVTPATFYAHACTKLPTTPTLTTSVKMAWFDGVPFSNHLPI